MNQRNLLRDVTLMFAAGAIGWWAHGANSTVRAADSRSEAARDGGNLAFQFGGAGLEGSLTLYNPENRTLYVYPSAVGNSHVNCAYSIHVDKAGGPLERQNCAIGSFR